MKKQVLYSIVCLSLLFVFISCSNDNETVDIQELNLKVQNDVAYILKSAKTIREDVEGNRNPLPNFSTQAELDVYLVMVGEQPGSVTLSFFNQVLGYIGVAETEGMQYFLNQQPYTAFAKSTLLTNSDGEVISGLTQQADFLNLDISEKETILLSNMLTDNLPPDIRANGCYVAVVTGISIGTAICGPGCGVAGGIVGVVYCFWEKSQQQ
ncbi:MAG: hypothetical protein ACI9M9_002548 [Flavobacteriaceae bacterium]|jgi:hypothetical protein